MARAGSVVRGAVLLGVVCVGLLLAGAGCDEQSGSGKRLIRPGAGSGGGGDDKAMSVAKDDPAMNAAMDDARKSLDTFLTRLLAPQAGDSSFAIKKKFQYRGNIEYMWVSDIAYSSRTQEFTGILGNDPDAIPNVKLGDRVKVKADEVADWMYISNGKLVGGYTVRVLRKKLPASERAKFDRDFGARIED